MASYSSRSSGHSNLKYGKSISPGMLTTLEREVPSRVYDSILKRCKKKVLVEDIS
jgi:hypothetical protein